MAHEIGNSYAQSVDREHVHPFPNRAENVLDDFFVLKIEFGKIPIVLVTFVIEAVAARSVSGKVDFGKPIDVARFLHVAANIAESPKSASDMIEKRIEQNADSIFMKRVANRREILVASKTTVERVEIARVVSVRVALQDRRKIDGVHI